MEHFDVIVIGGGVIGTSVAFHLAALGARRVLLLERHAVGAGTSSQSSGLLRTHYSVLENVELARRSWAVFNDFPAYVEDDEASCGIVRCGYMITADPGDKLEPLRAALDQQVAQGIRVEWLTRAQARELLPIAQFERAALIGFEPDAGFADATMTTMAFARSARRKGVVIREGVAVTNLLREGNRVVGVATSEGQFHCETVVSTQNIWTRELAHWLGRTMPVVPERHTVMALECAPAPYTATMPVFKDLSSEGMLYYRSYGGRQMLVSEGLGGEVLPEPDASQGEVSLDLVAEVGAQVALRFPAYETAGLASSWTGVYDVTPDWNPVLGRVPGVGGLVVGFGFSGHGFKLSPTVGRVLAQEVLGMPTEVSLAPYAIDRFESGALLVGRYGSGAVS